MERESFYNAFQIWKQHVLIGRSVSRVGVLALPVGTLCPNLIASPNHLSAFLLSSALNTPHGCFIITAHFTLYSDTFTAA